MKVVVVPNAKRFEIKNTPGGLKVWLRCKPENGKANRELLDEFSARTGKTAFLVSGTHSRRKEIAFDGMTDADAITALTA